jgi:hypothetical protein
VGGVTAGNVFKAFRLFRMVRGRCFVKMIPVHVSCKQFIVDEMTGRGQGKPSCQENENALKLDMWAPVPLWRPLLQTHHFCNRYVLAPSELHACAGSRKPSDCSKMHSNAIERYHGMGRCYGSSVWLGVIVTLE